MTRMRKKTTRMKMKMRTGKTMKMKMKTRMARKTRKTRMARMAKELQERTELRGQSISHASKSCNYSGTRDWAEYLPPILHHAAHGAGIFAQSQKMTTMNQKRKTTTQAQDTTPWGQDGH
jgi:predicted ATPase